MPDGVELDHLAEAARRLLREHVDALEAPPVPDAGRHLRLVARLEADLDGPLLEGLRALAPEGVRDGAVDTREVARHLEEVDRALAGEQAVRVRLAAAVALKRVTEASGILFTLHQALQALDRAPPTEASEVADAAARWARLHRRLRGAADALTDALDRWARLPGGPTPRPVDVDATLHRARGLLLAGSERAARLELARALEAALAEKAWGRGQAGRFEDALEAWTSAGALLPSAPEAVRRLHRAVLSEGEDPVVAWRLLDAVEAVANRAAMTPWPQAPQRANGNP